MTTPTTSQAEAISRPRDCLKAALEYLANGFWPVAIKPGDKAPIGAGWGAKRQTAESLHRVFARNPGAGVGLVLGPGKGPMGGWLVDLDGDGEGAETSVSLLMGGDPPATFGWESKRGRHRLYLADPERLGPLVDRIASGDGPAGGGALHLPELPGLEIRTSRPGKQHQSVAPPTDGRRSNKVREVAPLPGHVYEVLAAIADARESSGPRTPAIADGRPGRGDAWKVPVGEPATREGAYREAALAGELEAVRSAPQGGRNNALNKAAYKVAGLFGDGTGAAGAKDQLRQAAKQAGLADREIEDTIRSAWSSGSSARREIPPPGNGRLAGGQRKAARDLAGEGCPATPAAAAGDEPEGPVEDGWPSPDPAMFYGIANEFCRMVEPHTEADPVAILVQFLAAFGNLVGFSPHFMVGATRHSLRLFVTLVGLTSSGRKGTSLDLVMKVLGEVDPEWRRACYAEGLSSGEGLKWRVRDPVEDKDGKVIDEGISDKRLLVAETEFGSTLTVMSRTGNTLSGVIRQAWDSSTFTNLTRHDKIESTNHHICILCHVTFDEIKELLTRVQTANGFGNRFLWIASRSSKDLPSGGDLDDVDFSDLLARLRGLARFSKSMGKIRRSRGAERAWDETYREVNSTMPGGLLGAILGRAAPQIMRMACVYALLDGSVVVEPVHLSAARAVWDYCEQSARLVFGDSLGSPAAEKLLGALREAPEGLTRKQISSEVFARNKDAKAIQVILGELLTFGRIHRVSAPDPGKRGRPAERWKIGRASQGTN